MKRSLAAVVFLYLCSPWSSTMAGKKDTEFTNMWIAEIHGGEEVAQRVARDLGYSYKSQAVPFENHYVLMREDHPEVSKRSSHHLTRSLLDVDEVKWAEQQAIVQRSKRGFVPERPAQQYHERDNGYTDTKLRSSGDFDSESRGLGDGSSWSSGSGYGGSGYGRNGYGSTGSDRYGSGSNFGFDKAGFGSSGFGSSGFGGSGFGGSGLSNTDSGGQTGDYIVYVPVSGTDTDATIVNNVLSKVGSNKVGILLVCNSAVGPATITKVTNQLISSRKVSSGGLMMSKYSNGGKTVSSIVVNGLVSPFEASGQVGTGKVAVVFIKGDGSSDKKVDQGGTAVGGNNGFNSAGNTAGSNDNIVYVTVSSTDSDGILVSNVLNALGSNRLGMLLLYGSPLGNSAINNLVNTLGSYSKLGSSDVKMMQLDSAGGPVDKVGVKSALSDYLRSGELGNGLVAVVVSKGRGDTGASGGNSGGSTNPLKFGGSGFGGDASAGKPSESIKPSTGSKPSGTPVSGGSGVPDSSKPVQTGSISSNDKCILVNVDETSSIGDYIRDKIGDNKKVGIIVVNGGAVDSDTLSSLSGELSLYDLASDDGMPIAKISSSSGEPIDARGIFKSVSDLESGGHLKTGQVVVVLTKGKYVDSEALFELFGEADQGDTSKLGTFPTQPTNGKQMLSTYAGVTKHIGCFSSKTSAYATMFNDPLWPMQWYMQDYRTTNVPVMDHNIVPVWGMGITGLGVTVAVVDDGVVHNHPDLATNFDVNLSYDMCLDKSGSEPSAPDAKGDNSHGTKCAGEIGMVANNGVCGVGIAYNAKIGGVKILGMRAVEYGEAKGLVYKLDKYDIYSNSWGPTDDGLTLGSVGHMTDISFNDGTTKGRDGKGAIYVFSAGNGREKEDNCALDGMINHLTTIPIASVSQRGKTVHYSERCTAIFAGTYSGGNAHDEAVATTDINNGCTTTFSGTSAAAPIATGIIALVLQAKPELTYRDVMHLIAMTSEVAPLANNEDIWYKNGRGFWVSNDFGFGLMNAENMVKMAKTWKTVPKRNTCIVAVNLESPQVFSVGNDGTIDFETEACQDKDKDKVFYLEQIELASTIQYPFRGAISMKITSPAGTMSDILEKRIKDSDTDGLNEWSIKSVHNWGENPKGKWKIEVKANPISSIGAATGYVHGFTLLLHGTVEKPQHYNTPRTYAGFRLPNGKTSEV